MAEKYKEANLKSGVRNKYSRNLKKKQDLENHIELLKLIVPELILEHFDLVNTITSNRKCISS
jgi:hypothetical protein